MSGQRVAHYARESDAGSVAAGDHLSQWARSEAASAEAGEIVVAQVIEQQSGAMIESRKVFLDLLARGRRGEIDAIRIDRLDRLGRGDAQAVLRYEARRAGVRLVYNTPGPDADTTEGVIAGLVDQLTSGMERLKIRDRFIHAKLARARAGRVLATGKLLYGWTAIPEIDARGRRVGTRVEIVEDEIALVRDMIRDVLAGTSVRELCAQLETAGIPGPRGGPRWHPSTVITILRSTMLKGEWQFMRRETRLVDTPAGQRRLFVRRRDASEVISLPVPRIMSDTEWDQLQARINSNRIEKFHRKAECDYLLRGLIRCALCGRAYSAVASVRYITQAGEPRIYSYYGCRALSEVKGHRCHAGRRKAETVDAAVWAVVEGWLIDDASIAAGEASMPRPDLTGFNAQIELARRAEATAEGKLRGVLREKIGKDDNDPGLSMLAELEAEHVRGLRLARARRAQAETDRAAAERAASQQAEIRDLKNALRERLATGGTPALRRAIVEALGVRCVFDGRLMQVTSVVGSAAISFV